MGSSPVEMLVQEHREVDGLLGRLMELGERIRSGDRVSPGTVRLGVGLLDAYLHRVHARQFDVELWPEALAAAPASCQIPLERVQDVHATMRQSAREILELTTRWARGDASMQERVAQRLIDLVAIDVYANRFEERQPFPCLATVLSPTVRTRLSAQFVGHRGTKRVLETNIARFLEGSRPLLLEAGAMEMRRRSTATMPVDGTKAGSPPTSPPTEGGPARTALPRCRTTPRAA